jgi:NAD(P)-dependent dehydrogenase (short-subunit alcohol dehydrogenase family)
MTSTLSAPSTTSRAPRPVGTVLVTGAASGLGRAVARAVAAAGGRPLLLDRVPVEADPELGDAPSVVADLADRRGSEAAIGRLLADAGGLDAVVTAAGTDRCGPMADVPAAEWEQVISVNLLGTAAVIRAALPALTASHGRIVTVASTLGLRALSDASAYCASKFGVVGMTRALAAELAGTVGVTLLVPGGMHTSFFDDRDDQYKPGADARLNRPEDVARTILFVLRQPPECEVRELVVTHATEGSWPP